MKRDNDKCTRQVLEIIKADVVVVIVDSVTDVNDKSLLLLQLKALRLCLASIDWQLFELLNTFELDE